MANSDDPFRPDPTSLRPRPGGGRRTVVGAPRAAAAPIALGPEAEPLPPSARAYLGIGLNPLVQAASPLLLLAGQIRDSLNPMDVAGLRRHTLDEIHAFEEQARSAGVPNGTILAARYTLCAGLDEAVLSTPWGSQSEWAQHPLLVALHREAWGGEKFFEMVERMSREPGRHIDLLELQYLLIAFGFEGKYHVQERGHEHLQQVQQDLYRQIQQPRGVPDRGLSLRWRGLEDRRNPLVRYVPWWVIALAALPILAITFIVYYSSLANLAAPVKAELARVDDAPPPPQPAAPVAGPTLKQLLAPEEQRGVLTVEERGPETTITLVAGDLFPSGSATVNPGYIETLHRVTAALNKVPGRVRVVGHTDNQPIRSLRFSDNYELSRERAVSVVNVLQDGIDNRGRLSYTGVGDDRPRYQPASDPENRARNRRVEIVHVRGG